MEQERLFSESIYDALKDVVRALGGNKTVGVKLRPELTATAAGDWLKDCLNPEDRHRLDPEQMLWILREGRKVGCHSAIHYLCDDAGYAHATPVDPLDEAAELQRRFIEAVRESKRIADRLDRLGMRAVA